MSEDNQSQVRQEAPAIPFAEFLENIPPSTPTNVLDLAKPPHLSSLAGFELVAPDIQLHCPNDTCNGTRFFRCSNRSTPLIPDDNWEFFYLQYACSNCRRTQKTFSLAARRNKGDLSGICYKFGELPEYGPPTPSRLIKLVGPDREAFLKGRRCENQGLGVGAFAYYRRVVENQRNRILDEIIKVSKKLAAPPSMIQTLEEAKAETQFSKAMVSVKNAIPQALLIDGHNPLALLHSALSGGLHEKSDEQCLELAHSIRVVLAELSERLAQALKDEAELNNALARLMKVKKDG